jgi:hypothetical protein
MITMTLTMLSTLMIGWPSSSSSSSSSSSQPL